MKLTAAQERTNAKIKRDILAARSPTWVKIGGESYDETAQRYCRAIIALAK